MFMKTLLRLPLLNASREKILSEIKRVKAKPRQSLLTMIDFIDTKQLFRESFGYALLLTVKQWKFEEIITWVKSFHCYMCKIV